MRLSARPIVNYCNVNDFAYGNQWTVRAGDPLTLYFQIVDLDKGPYALVGDSNNLFGQASQLQGSVGLRYIVGVGTDNQPSQVLVTFPSIDDDAAITAIATQADPNDGSIWKLTLQPNQQPSGGAVQFAVTEGSATRRFNVQGMLSVEYPMNDGCC